MPYFIRVLGTNASPISLADLRRGLPEQTELSEETKGTQGWTQLVLRHKNENEIAVIERNDVAPGELGAEEIAEFKDEVTSCEPKSAAQWLVEYFPRVRVIYAFQLLDGTETNDGWSAVHALQSAIWSHAGGILQSDGEGFTNEDGFHVLWQFSDRVSGNWNCAVLTAAGEWTRFQMELGDPAQRRAFLSGRVPEGARLV